MTRLLGSPVPGRFGIPASASPNFPQAAGTYTDPTGAITVPGEALDRWFAYRRNPDARRRDVVCIGDSTTYGSGGNYSWVQRFRDRAASFGLPPGGKGIFGGGESFIAYDAPEVNGFVEGASWGGGFPDAFDNLAGQYFYDTGTTGGHTLTFQFKGTAMRLWYTRRQNVGEFTYAIDGEAPITVSAYKALGVTTVLFVYRDGLSDGLHTVVITNRGGRVALPPDGISASSSSFGAPNALPDGTYYYAATYTFGGGETVKSNVATLTLAGGRTVTVAVPEVGQDATTGVRIFRAANPAGPFQLVTTARVGGSATVGFYIDSALNTPDAGQVPPTVGTTNLNTSAKAAYVAFAALRDDGLAIQKQATSGGTMVGFVTSEGARIWTAFGLAAPTGDSTLAASYAADGEVDADGRPDPVLAILHLGFNDLSNAPGVTAATFTDGVNRFAAMCDAAGCDGIVMSGQLPYNASWPSYGAARFAALKAAALAHGLAFVDIFYPVAGPSLSYAGGVHDPHLTKPQYVAQADFLWDYLLGAT